MVDAVFKHKRGVVNAAMYCLSGYCQPKRLIGELNSEGKLNCQNSHFLFQLLKHNKKHHHKPGVYIFGNEYNLVIPKIPKIFQYQDYKDFFPDQF